MKRLFIYIFILAIAFTSCAKKSKISGVPQISFKNILFDTLSLVVKDSVYINSMFTFNYQVKNGLITGDNNFIFTSTLDTSINLKFSIPKLNTTESKKDQETGTIDVIFLPTDLQPFISKFATPYDSVKWNVYLLDANGNKSNVVETNMFHLKTQ